MRKRRICVILYNLNIKFPYILLLGIYDIESENLMIRGILGCVVMWFELLLMGFLLSTIGNDENLLVDLFLNPFN
jgi:hypothetical protein